MTPGSVASAAPWAWALDASADDIVLRLSGSWRMQDHLPSPTEVETELTTASAARRLTFQTRGVTAWDTGFLVFVLNVRDAATSLGLTVDRSGLPEGVRKLLDLAAAVPERDTKGGGDRPRVLSRLGASATSVFAGARAMISFIGHSC